MAVLGVFVGVRRTSDVIPHLTRSHGEHHTLEKRKRERERNASDMFKKRKKSPQVDDAVPHRGSASTFPGNVRHVDLPSFTTHSLSSAI